MSTIYKLLFENQKATYAVLNGIIVVVVDVGCSEPNGGSPGANIVKVAVVDGDLHDAVL